MIVPYGWLSVSPSLQNECRILASNGYDVDVFHLYDARHDPWDPPSPNINVIPVRLQFSVGGPWPEISQIIRSSQAVVKFFRRIPINDYNLLIGVDIFGLFYSSLLTLQSSGGPMLIYHSLESMRTDNKVLKWLEWFGSKFAKYGVTLGEQWAAGIAERTHLERDNIFVVPNAPMGAHEESDSSVLRQLGIPQDKNVAIYSGSFVSGHMVKELVATASDWPSEWVLVVHGWGPEDRIPILKEEAGELLDQRVFISNEVLPDDEYTALLRSADIGIALLSKDDKRKWQLAHPGKVYKYLQAGIPVVTSATPTMKPLIEENDCGVCISDPDGVSTAIEDIVNHYEEYSSNCRMTFKEYEYATNYQAVLNVINNSDV